MKLVVAEKPSVARSIASVLGAYIRKDGYFEGNGYIVTWCIGHLVSLASPEAYDKSYGKWDYEDLPILPESWLFQVKSETKKQYDIIKKLMNDDRVESIVEATDSGREGELIFRLVYNQADCNKSYERLWISSMEDIAIRSGFEKLRDGRDYENLYQSALVRSQADWIVGLNATRLFTTKFNSKLSIGRVQTPTLAIIVKRDNEIINFQKEKFYHVELNLYDFKVKSERLRTIEDVHELISFCEGKTVAVDSIEKALKKKKAPKLFDLTTLQREANRYFGYTAKQTLEYAQSLYEKKLITYPRTDSSYITSDMESSTRVLLEGLGEHECINIKRIIDNTKVTDHHAILPTTEALSIDTNKIPGAENNILSLIKMKVMASVALDYVYEDISVKVLVEDREFKTSEKLCIEPGYERVLNGFKRAVLGKESSDSIEKKLMKINKGSKYSIESAEKVEGYTTPPKHFTEDTLLSAMERAGIEELDENLDTEKKGLGTPATRASIIEKLIHIGYIERKSKNLLATSKGTELIKIVPEKIKSPVLTAEWENKLTKIANGNFDPEVFISGIKDEIIALVSAYADFESEITFKSEKESIGNCPRCNAEVYESSKNFYCSSKDCDFNMWKEDKFFVSKKKKLTKSIANSLLSKGKVKVKGLYSSMADKSYDATVILDDTGKWVNYKLEFK